MILSRRIALNGAHLDELYGRIVIRGIDVGASKENIRATTRMGGAGQRITEENWEPKEVSVKVAIMVPKRDLITRRKIWEDICSWARSGEHGWLTVNYILDKRLYVEKAILPDSGDLWDWTDDLTITFRAYSIPFWQDETPTRVTDTGTEGGEYALTVNGQHRTVVDCEFTNTSGSSIDTFAITADGNTITLTGLGLADSKTLKIHHGTDGLLRITADGVNAYGKQSAGGADDLYVEPGTATVSVTAGGEGDLTISCTGRYA